jgi:hypothetical protein
MGERDGFDHLKDPQEGFAAGYAVGQLKPLAQPDFMQLGALLHYLAGATLQNTPAKAKKRISPQW